MTHSNNLSSADNQQERSHLRVQDIPFTLKSKKARDYEIFKAITVIVFAKQHLTKMGMKKLLNLRETMNAGGNRKYLSKEILNLMRVKSSETIRQIPIKSGMI